MSRCRRVQEGANGETPRASIVASAQRAETTGIAGESEIWLRIIGAGDAAVGGVPHECERMQQSTRAQGCDIGSFEETRQLEGKVTPVAWAAETSAQDR